MAKRRVTGWHLGIQHRMKGQVAVPIERALWEKFLEAEGVTEPVALRSLKRAPKSERSRQIVSWIKLNYRTHFVPSRVLEAMGMVPVEEAA